MRPKVSSGISLRIPVVVLLTVLALAACTDREGEGLAVGDKAPGFSLPEASGSTVSLEDFAGTATLLYFHMADG